MQATYFAANLVSRSPMDRNREVSPPRNGCGAKQSQDTVYLIDEDFRVREALSEILNSLEIRVISFGSAAEYLEYRRPDEPACLVVDMQLPDPSGTDLQQQIAVQTSSPIIFMSGHADIPATVRVMKAGAFEFLTKPVDPAALVEAVRAALAQGRKLRQRKAELAKLQQRLSLLTPREREVFPLTVGGLLNKQAASLLGISEVTLQIHRRQVMRKMEAECFADLVRMALKLRIPHWRVEDLRREPAMATHQDWSRRQLAR